MANITAAADEYRHVTVAGIFLDDSQTLVQAVTDLGAGYWVVTPLRSAEGNIVLVNRGFVQADDRDRVQPGATPQPAVAAPTAAMTRPDATSAPVPTRAGPPPATPPPSAVSAMHADPPIPAATARVTGLLRMTEPHGGFLRRNDPAGNRWYSRDVQAIAAAHGLLHVAPYFIDAEATPGDANAAQGDANAPPGDTNAAQGDANAPPGDTNAAQGDANAARPAPDRSGASSPSPPTNGLSPKAPNGALVAPVAGLTVIAFHNSHLVYAITWYTLALMVAVAMWVGIRKQ